VREPSEELNRSLEPYDRKVAELALGLRAIVLDEAPEAVEVVYDAFDALADAFTLTGDLKDAFCHVAVASDHVRLGFDRGAELPDPDDVLEGTGRVARFIRVTSPADLKKASLRKYLRAARDM
jgi:hypothetical protein